MITATKVDGTKVLSVNEQLFLHAEKSYLSLDSVKVVNDKNGAVLGTARESMSTMLVDNLSGDKLENWPETKFGDPINQALLDSFKIVS